MRNTYCEVSLGAVENNFKIIRGVCDPQTKICAVVKANAYGHGLVPVAKRLEQSGVDYLAVALAEEGKELRSQGIKTPILVMAGVDEADIEICIDYDLTITASSIEKLQQIIRAAENKQKVPVVHLKIDSGMNRIGVHWNRANPFLSAAQSAVEQGAIICEGIYTHFADAMDPEYTKIEFNRFKDVLDEARAMGFSIPIAHACNSRALFLYPEFHLNMVRSGIAMYGIEPETDRAILPSNIRPALEWKSKVIYFKVVEKGESVGYGRSWKIDQPFARIVTIPVGYADGFPRRLSNTGSVIIRGMIYPIIGRVCMDQIMVSIGETGTSYLDDNVTLIGHDGDARITVEMLAEILQTTPHEITTCISNRVPRRYID